MWIPRSWADVEGLIGKMETSSLDFKRDLPASGKGEEFSKDVAALTVEGGVLIFGVDEDKATLEATAIVKVPLAGAPEQLQAFIGRRIEPIAQVSIGVLKEDEGDADGVVVVVVEPSKRAPHMVAHRFPVRRGTITEYMGEAEVEQMYVRRTEVAPSVDVLARLDAALSADDLAGEVARAARNNELALLPALLSRLRTEAVRAVQFGPDTQGSVDRLTSIAAALASSTGDPKPLAAAIREHHRLFAAGRQLQGPVNARHDLELFRFLRPNVLALGGLLVRLERWDAARALVDYSGPELGGVPRSWILFMATTQHRASPVRNAEAYRHPIRSARQVTVERLALHPDQADEHVALDSVIAFEVIANVIELGRAHREGYAGEVYPDAALFDAAATQPIIQRLLSDVDVRQAVLPDLSETQVAQLVVEFDQAASKVLPETTLWEGALTSEARAIVRGLGVLPS